MTASASTPSRAAVIPAIPLHRRLYGFGSIYGKTIRDSRLAFIVAAGLLGGMALVMGVAVSNIFPSPQARLEVDKLVGSMPASMVNLFGNATAMGAKLGTLGGYMTFKYGAIFAIGTTVSSTVFGNASQGDTIPPLSSAGFALWTESIALFFGGLAFALSPLLGRAGSAAIAALSMAVLWFTSGLDVGGPLVAVSPFHWTVNHIALVGMYDWLPVALVGATGAILLVIGVELFVRRDLGVTAGLSLPGLPTVLLGVHGPVSRAMGEQLPRALSWGIGIGLIGALYASLVGPMATQLGHDSSLVVTMGALFPNVDLASTGGWMQLYAELLYIAAGFGAATFVSKWASEEGDGQLEMVLTTPTTRVGWTVAGGIAAILAVAGMTVLFALGVGLGASSGGVPAGDAILGSASLGLYAAAVVGIGVAVGGLWRTSLAGEIAALFVVATYLLDLVAPPLKLPDWVHQLALTAHMGRPMVGEWDPVGITACVVIAAGGILLGAWGLRRRDIGR